MTHDSDHCFMLQQTWSLRPATVVSRSGILLSGGLANDGALKATLLATGRLVRGVVYTGWLNWSSA